MEIYKRRVLNWKMNGQGLVISQQFWSKCQWMMFTCTYPWCLLTSHQCYMILFPSSFLVRNVTKIWVQLKSSTKSWIFFKLKMIWMTLFVLNKDTLLFDTHIPAHTWITKQPGTWISPLSFKIWPIFMIFMAVHDLKNKNLQYWH